MEITKKEISLCSQCNNWKGTVEEKYNGKVPVHCVCTLSASQQNGTRSPSMISSNGDYLWWTPISEHIAKDGCLCHTAHFSGPAMNRKK